MNREALNGMMAWKGAPMRRPLVLRGARQVGKTWAVKEFAARNYQTLFRLDFVEEPKFRRIFAGSLNPSSVISQVEAEFGKRVEPETSLLFLDEVQACANALKSLRYFFEEAPRYHVIAAGSLLELAMAGTSFPVGSVDYLWMYPMTFSEFLRGTGSDILAEHLPGLGQTEPLATATHEKLLEMVRLYCAVGGMPQAVEVFRRTGSLLDVTATHASLMQSYVDDLNKYRGRLSIDGIDRLLSAIPSQVGRQVKYRSVEPEWRIEKTKSVLRLLEQLMLVHPVRSTNCTGLPLGSTASEKVFKYVFLDVGLVHHQCGGNPAALLQGGDLLGVHEGRLAEQFVGQELLARGGSENRKLYYWDRPERASAAEVDYVVVRDRTIVPVEVKSGPAGRLRSMTQYLREHPGTERGVVLSSANVRHEPAYRLAFLPIYTQV